VDFPERGDRDYRAGLGLSDDTPVILMLGGLRQVKQMDYAIAVLKKIRRRHPTFQLLIAGPLLEPEATADLDEALRVHPWIRYLGEVPRHQVPSLIEQSDLVLNTSRSESESNAILEALSFGRIVIARDIPGNAHLGTGAAGLLFRNRQELERQLLAVLEQPEQWAAAGKRARRRIAAFHRPNREMKAYAALYRDVSRASPRARR
jgi:glycosyltransferase involved in cell wall biosynthesis